MLDLKYLVPFIFLHFLISWLLSLYKLFSMENGISYFL